MKFSFFKLKKKLCLLHGRVYSNAAFQSYTREYFVHCKRTDKTCALHDYHVIYILFNMSCVMYKPVFSHSDIMKTLA